MMGVLWRHGHGADEFVDQDLTGPRTCACVFSTDSYIPGLRAAKLQQLLTKNRTHLPLLC
jgi:hypothetical protein